MMEAQQDVDHLLREDERKLEPPAQKRPVRHQPEPQKKPPKRDSTKDNVKSRENQEKSDRRVLNEQRIVWNLSIGKQTLFPGSRAGSASG